MYIYYIRKKSVFVSAAKPKKEAEKEEEKKRKAGLIVFSVSCLYNL